MSGLARSAAHLNRSTSGTRRSSAQAAISRRLTRRPGNHDREGRRRRTLGILTAATAIVDKPADEDEHAGHHHGHAR
jgi:hypothetical protein